MHHRIQSRFAVATLLALLATPAASAEREEDFVRGATTLNLFQIRSSELAVDKGTKDETKALAREILSAHKDAQQRLATAAKADGIAVPEGMDDEQNQKLEALDDAPPSDFDAAYMSAQISAYSATGQLYQDFMKAGEAGQLRSFAEKTYPQLHMMETRVKAQSSPGAVTDGAD